MNIYLDIDGTLIHEDLNKFRQPAEGLMVFLQAIRSYNLYWLTTHCMDGNRTHAQAFLKSVTPEELHTRIDLIKPTTWHTLKTEAIDFTKPFMWLDNDVLKEERTVLREKAIHDKQWLIEVDLVDNPARLVDITRDYFADSSQH